LIKIENIRCACFLLRKSNKFGGFAGGNTVFLVLPRALWQNRNNFLITVKSRLARGALQI
jgi:hypothetical protein